MEGRLKVLWATDGSASANAAAPLIQSLVLPVAASVRVLTVAPAPRFSGARLDPVYMTPWSSADKEQALALAANTARHAADLLHATSFDIGADARFGHPIQEILSAAQRDRADLIVMGAKGHSNLRLMLLGSVAQGVLEYANRPTLLVRPGSTSVDTVVAGVDGSKESLKAVEFLQSLSLDPESLIVLAQVVQLISEKPSTLKEHDAFGAEARRLNERAMRQAEKDLAAALDVLRHGNSINELLVGRAGEELLKAAALRNADLITVGSRRPSRIRKYLVGSIAEMIAREAVSSVLVVR
jgi:nucleotide-binding universal stress UspA family protein